MCEKSTGYTKGNSTSLFSKGFVEAQFRAPNGIVM